MIIREHKGGEILIYYLQYIVTLPAPLEPM